MTAAQISGHLAGAVTPRNSAAPATAVSATTFSVYTSDGVHSTARTAGPLYEMDDTELAGNSGKRL